MEEGKPASDVEERSARQGTVDMLDLQYALQKIHPDLMMQEDRVKGLTNVIEVTDIIDISSVLTTTGSVTGTASSLPGRTTVEKKNFEETKAPKELEMPGTHIIVVQGL